MGGFLSYIKAENRFSIAVSEYFESIRNRSVFVVLVQSVFTM